MKCDEALSASSETANLGYQLGESGTSIVQLFFFRQNLSFILESVEKDRECMNTWAR